jgi:hypothetical protein
MACYYDIIGTLDNILILQFQYANVWDIIAGTLMAVAAGLGLPGHTESFSGAAS